MPTDTPPGNNAPHAERTAELLAGMGLQAEKHPVPAAEVQAYGLQSITNLIVRRRFGDGGPVIALNAHGDVVPPGEGWTHDPYGGEIVDGKLYGRASAVSKSDFASLHLRAARARSAAAAQARQRRTALHLRRGIRRRARPRLAAEPRPDQARPADRRRLQLPGRHRAQRLPAARGHAARPGLARRVPGRPASTRCRPRRSCSPRSMPTTACCASAARRSKASRTPT